MISVITEIEVLAGVRSIADERPVRQFLERFEILPVSKAVVEQTISLRRALRLKVPDAIIYATARAEGCLLITRNTRDFGDQHEDVRAPYQL